MQRLRRNSTGCRPRRVGHATTELVVARIAQPLIIERRDDERLPIRSQHDATQFERMLDARDLRHETDARPITDSWRHVGSKCRQLECGFRSECGSGSDQPVHDQ